MKDSNGSWVQRSFTVEGSYMIFEFTQGETAFALEELPAEEFPVAAVAQDRVASMEVSIKGKINALIASIPMKLTAGFHFE